MSLAAQRQRNQNRVRHEEDGAPSIDKHDQRSFFGDGCFVKRFEAEPAAQTASVATAAGAHLTVTPQLA
jgi:hypothetical protein